MGKFAERISTPINLVRTKLGFGPQKTKSEIHDYWRKPPAGDIGNHPDTYTSVSPVRSSFLVQKVSDHVGQDARIMEIGCNAGRNLNTLFGSGYKGLSAVEISQSAIDVLRKTYTDLAAVPITVSPVEDAIKALADDSRDLIFTMAVLEHIHFDSDWIFAEMKRISPLIMTIEDEGGVSPRHFPRNYQKVFEGLGMTQVDFQKSVPGLPTSFRYRLFRR